MAESILVTGKKISSMELVTNVTGNEKIPTGQSDDLALTPNQIADHTIVRGDLANQEDLSQVEVSLGTQITDVEVSLGTQITALESGVNASNNSIRGLIAAEEAARIAADNLKVDKEGSVSSVAGRVGNVVLAHSDVLVEGFGSQEDVNKYVPKPFLSGYAYGLGERVVLDDGEVVKSLIDGNVSDPNGSMVGWVSVVSDSLATTVQTFNTPEAGVDPVTGVADGAYFNVRSTNDESYVDEYQNVGGSAVATGKSYPSAPDVVTVDSIADLLALPEGKRKEGRRYLVTSYYGAWAARDPYVAPSGGGSFLWDGTMPKSNHNGFTVIDPDALWDGTAQDLGPFFLSSNQGTGCFLLVRQEHYSVDQCGALGDGVTNDAVALNQALKYAVNLTFRTSATYAIRSEVVAPTGVSDISIEGNGAEIKRLTGYTSKRMLVFEKNRNLRVSNLRLNGNAPTVLGTCEAITARACHGLRYDHLHVYDIREAGASDERRHTIRLLGCDNAIVANSSGINCSGKIFEALIFTPSMYLDELDYYVERGGIRAPIYRNCLAVDAGGVHHQEEPFFAMGQTSDLVVGLEEAPAITPVIYDECVGIAGPNSRFGFRGTSANGILDAIFNKTHLHAIGFNTIEFKPDIGGSLKVEGGRYIATRTDSAIAVIVSGRGAPVSGLIDGAEIIAEGTSGVTAEGLIRLVNTDIKGSGTANGVYCSDLQMERCTVEGFNFPLNLAGTCSVQDAVLLPSVGGQAIRVRQSLYTSLLFTRGRLEGQVRVDRQSGSQIKLKFDGCEFHSTTDQLQLIREYDGAGSQAYIHTSFNGCEFFGRFGNLLYVTLSGGSTCKFSMQSSEVHEQVAAVCRILYGGDGPNGETSVSARFNFYGNGLAAGSGYYLVASTITPRFVGVLDPDKTIIANLDMINFRG